MLPFPLARADLFIRHLLQKIGGREGNGEPINAATTPISVNSSALITSNALRSVALDETSAQAAFCGGTDAPAPPPWVERWVETAQATISLESSGGYSSEGGADGVSSDTRGHHLCGVEAGGQILHLLAKEPVLVEPLPVQMLALTSRRSEALAAQQQSSSSTATAPAAIEMTLPPSCTYLTDASLVSLSPL